MLTRDLLNELFRYDEEIGQLRRRVRRNSYGGRAEVNDVAGTVKANGYRKVGINGKHYFAHRIIWTMQVGKIPGGCEIDHIDGNPDNNRISNLRLATRSENNHNAKTPTHNTSGTKGVYFDSRNRKWMAQAVKGGKRTRMGFATKERAESFVRRLREQLHQEFANHGVHKCHQKQ